MNLHTPPIRNGSLTDELRTLRMVIEEKNGIIHSLQRQQGLLKKSLLESSLQAKELSHELEEASSSLEGAKRDAERWKIEAFQSIQHSNSTSDVRSSPLYIESQRRIKELETALQAQQTQHEQELQDQEATLTAQHLAEIAEQEKKLRKAKEHEPEPSPRIIQESSFDSMPPSPARENPNKKSEKKNSTPEENDGLDDDGIDRNDPATIPMLEAQLRQAEEHVLEQSELLQRTCMQLQLEIDRRNKCRKCRRQAEKDEKF